MAVQRGHASGRPGASNAVIGFVMLMQERYTHVFKFFLVFCKCFSCSRRMLQVFHLDVAKSRLGVAHVAMHMRGKGSVSGLCAWSGGASVVRAARAPCGRTKCRLGQGRAGPSAGNGVQRGRACPDVWALALLL
jgi:hypothetical protein